jgi:ABC-2 type transport system ATP-binding protein
MIDWVLSLGSVTKTFANGKTAVREVSSNVGKGDFIGFVGPNGAGKTTAIRIMIGALAPSSGSVKLFGQVMTPDATELKRRIGYVPSDEQLFEHLTGREQVELSAMAYGVPPSEAGKRIGQIFTAFNLEEGGARIRHYSHGMKKKVALACALVHDPDIMFLDEPLEGLDVFAARKTYFLGCSSTERPLC